MVNLEKREFLRSLFLAAGAVAVAYILSKVKPIIGSENELTFVKNNKKAKIRVAEDGSLIVG